MFKRIQRLSHSLENHPTLVWHKKCQSKPCWKHNQPVQLCIMKKYDYWFFLSWLREDFVISVLMGFWTLARASRPKNTMGSIMKRKTKSETINSEVSSWYFFKIPPTGSVALAYVIDTVSSVSRSRTGRSILFGTWRLKKLGVWRGRGEPMKITRWFGKVFIRMETSAPNSEAVISTI